MFLIAVIEQQYTKPYMTFDALLEETLDVYLIDEAGPREAYKHALGKIFGRRSAYKQFEERRRGKYAPFAPR